MTSEAEVLDDIRDVFCKEIEPGIPHKKVVEERERETWKRIGDFDRNGYRKILNNEIRRCFYKLVDKEENLEDVNLLNSIPFGTSQWSDKSYNIRKSDCLCPHGCIYCFILPIVNKNFDHVDIQGYYLGLLDIVEKNGSWEEKQACRPELELDWDKVLKGWGKGGVRKLYMMPTSHDIVPEILHAFIIVCISMLKAGHSILITTKPRMECMKLMCDVFDSYNGGKYKDKITCRFTITSNDQEIINKWEWLAPTYEERLECLKYAHERGFKTSISTEPFLSDPVALSEEVLPFVNDEMWVGMMNGYPSEKVLGIEFPKWLKDEIERLKNDEYTFENIDRIVQKLRTNPKIHFKESVIKTYLKVRGY